MYATYCATVSNVTAEQYLSILNTKLSTNDLNQFTYINEITSGLQQKIADNIKEMKLEQQMLRTIDHLLKQML